MFERFLFERLLSRVHHYHLFIEGDDDNPGGGGGSDGGDPAATDPGQDAGAAAGDAGNQGGGLAGLADEGGEGAAADRAGSADSEDWRTEDAGDDEKVLRELKRYASRRNVAKALIEAKARIRAGFQPPTLPENATPEQVAEYRKIIGVPETPEGYGVQFAPEIGADETLNGMLQSYLAFAHERNIPPAAVKAGVEWQQKEILRQRQEHEAAAMRAAHEVKSRLEAEYRGDFARNRTLTLEFLEGYPGLKRAIDALPMADIEVTRDIMNLALELAPIDRLIDGDASSGGKSIEEQIDELSTKSVKGTITPAEDKKYEQLLKAQMQRDERQQRGRAA